jgi:Holliday junction DNA helicase RuvA
MFQALTGELCHKTKERVHLDVNGVVYDILAPETVCARIDEHCVQNRVSLYIYDYIEMQQNRAFQVLVGFLNELEREFFEEIISVSGIGPKAAVRAFNKPVSEIAAAVEKGDVAALQKLPGIGGQRAKNLVAALQGKLARFLLLQDKLPESAKDTVSKNTARNDELHDDAMIVLAQLQYKKTEAEAMIAKARKANPAIDTLEALLSEIYKQR